MFWVVFSIYNCKVPNAGPNFSGFGVESTTKSIQKQIVDALGRGDRGTASNLLSDLGRGNHLLRADDFIDVLKYCARSPDPLVS